MQIIMIAFRTRQGGRMDSALLSVGSTWHARPLTASVCTVVPAAAVAAGHGRTFVRPMRRLTHQNQSETVGRRHPRSLTQQGFDASVTRKRAGNAGCEIRGVLYLNCSALKPVCPCVARAGCGGCPTRYAVTVRLQTLGCKEDTFHSSFRAPR